MRLASAVLLFAFWQVEASSHGADVRFVQVSKTVAYVQNGAAAPVTHTNAYEFRARVDLSRQDSMGTVSVKWPAPSNVTRALSNMVTYWEYSQRFSLSDTMNFTHPN